MVGIGDRAVVLEDENKRPYVNWLGDDFEYCTDLVKRLEEMCESNQAIRF